jgi:16S rRNA (guanine1207-N2)-methyltransferase
MIFASEPFGGLPIDHYFRPVPQAKEDIRVLHTTFHQQSFTFFTNAGVFARNAIDFGSRLLIETVKVDSAREILDLGCGYGPIGIAMAALHPTTHVTMVDINQRAVELTKRNAAKNQVAERISAYASDGFAALAEQRFDLILCNPPIRTGKVVIYQLFAEASKHLHPAGRLCIVIRKQQGASSAKKELQRLFSEVEVIEQKKGYCIIQAKIV